MKTSLVGSRYARALAEMVFRPGSTLGVATLSDQLKAVEELISSSPELHAILMTPAVQTSRKKAVIGKLAEELGVVPAIRNFLFVLLDHKRIESLPQVRAAFDDLVDEHLGFVQAEVTAAAPLDAAQTRSLQAELDQLSGKKVKMNTSIDPALLGGVVARIGSTVYDGSVRGQLDVLRRKLASESAEWKVGV